MYSILIKDYENKKSHITDAVAHYSNSLDLCEDLAFKFILGREGERYFKAGNYRAKNSIKKGYAICRKEDCIGLKLTIFHKEQNGFILSGELKKIIQFQTIKVGNNLFRDFADLDRESYMFDDWREKFDKVIKMIPISKETEEV